MNLPAQPSPEREKSPNHQVRVHQMVTLFTFAKLTAISAALLAYFSVLEPRWERVAILALLALTDALLLAPYNRWVRCRPDIAPRATLASTAFSAITATLGLYLTGSLTSPGVLAYLALAPLTCLAVPTVRAALLSAGISSVAYLSLAVAAALGLAPNVTNPYLFGAGEWAALVLTLAALWSTGYFAGRVFEGLDRRSTEREHQYEETRQRAEAEVIWDTIGRTLISTRDLDQVLTAVIQVINDNMQVEKAWVLLLDQATEGIDRNQAGQSRHRAMPAPRMPAGEGVAAWVVATGQPALVADVSRDKRWNRDIDRATEIAARSVLCVPLVAKEKVIGAVELINKRTGSFTPEDLRLLESIAAPVAIAIQNAQLHRQVQKQLDELTQLFGQVERAKQEWEASIDAIEEGILLLDPNGKLLRVNRTVANWLNTSPGALVGQHCRTALHGADAAPAECPWARIVASRERLSDVKVEYPHMQGTFRCTAYPLHESRGGLGGIVVVLKNITEEQRLQAHLIQSEKLTATGRMAASLAHEINNPLQAIQGCLDLAQANPSNMEKQERYLTMAKSEVDRLATIVQRMLDFYRPASGARTVLNAHELVEDVLVFSYKRLQHAQVTARVEWEAASSAIEGNANQLKQVFLNVILNAVDAMPTGGELVIRGQAIDQDGRWLTIDFTDSGTGIPEDQLEKIFEPFYTTKTTGTGLGLGISHSIVVAHGGRLTVASTIGKGTTFTVWLPLHSPENPEPPVPPA